MVNLNFQGIEPVRTAPATARAFVLDPQRVGRCLPDLQELQVADSRHFVAYVKVGVGPVRGRFRLDVELDPGDGSDGAGLSLTGSGMGSGLSLTSRLRFEPSEQDTNLVWEARAAVSGPLATVGGRLLEGQARKVIEQLFRSIRQELEGARNGAGG